MDNIMAACLIEAICNLNRTVAAGYMALAQVSEESAEPAQFARNLEAAMVAHGQDAENLTRKVYRIVATGR
jgi:hypothetical protein